MKNKLLLLYIFIFSGSLTSSATCDTASFTSNAGSCKNKIISFVNTSPGTFSTYFWDFGDGSTLSDTSDVQNPGSYTYPALGTYTATLIVDKGLPCADTFTAVVNMSFVTANFTQNAPRCISDSVNFIDASIVGHGSTITSWSWNFGNPGSGSNNISSLKNPSHLYTAGNQTFFVKLVTTSSAGCKDSITIGVGIQSLVTANAGTDIISCNNNLSVNLTGSISNAGGGFWSGSGSFSNITSMTPLYFPTAAAKANGKDTVLFTSFSSPYCPNVTDTVIISFNQGPAVNAGIDITVCKDTSGIPVSAIITGATGGTWHTVGAGGGTFANDNAVSTIYSPSTSDTAAGSVVLYIESTGNGICSASRDSLTIIFTPVQTVFIKTDDSSCSGSTIQLNVTVSTGAGTWSSSGSGYFLPFATTLNGYYYPSAADNLAGVITLKFVSSNNGGCLSAFDTLDVTIKPSPTAAFTSVGACEKDAAVVFTDTSLPTGDIVSWNWIFGDLSLPSSASSPTHVYSSCGNKNVTLFVTASNGCVNTKIQSAVVYCLPVANYSGPGICLNEGTEFTNTSVFYNGASLASSNWNFGDLTTSTLANPTHYFPSSGSFPVTLIVHSSEGCVDTITQTVSIVPGPTAVFTVSDPAVDVNRSISLTNQSIDDVSVLWNFGDLSPESILQDPTHIYSAGGVYNICLTAADLSGCKDTVCKQEIVYTNPSGPSGFSPNGDGQNDVFYVYGGPFKTLEFRIYNSWGELVFESNKQSVGWDGKFKGVDQAIGVYAYTVIGITENDIEFRVSGDVTLLR